MQLSIGKIAACVLLCGAPVMAEVKIETIPADQAGGMVDAKGVVKPLKLSLKDATFADAVAAFNKMAGIELKIDESPRAEAGPETIYDVAIDATSLPAALDQLAHALHVGIANTGDSLRIGTNWQEGYQNPNGNESNEVAGARLTNISINRSLTNGGMRTSSLAVSVTVHAGPIGLCGMPQIEVLEATDPQGNDLRTEQPGRQIIRFGGQRHRGGIGVAAALKMLDPAPTKLAKFRAEVTYQIPKTYRRVVITELPESPVDCEIGGAKVQVGPPTKQGESWTLKIQGPARNNDDQMDISQEMQHMKVFGPEGQALRLENRGGSGDGRSITYNAEVMPDPQRGGARADGQPAVRPSALVWEAVQETETIKQIIEAVDLPLP